MSHLRLMTEVTTAGGIVVPPGPAFYHRPTSVDAIINQTVGRVLDLFDLDSDVVQRWDGSQEAAHRVRPERRNLS